MKKFLGLLTGLALSASVSQAQAQLFVDATIDPSKVSEQFVATLLAGQTYNVSVTGSVTLATGLNPPLTFTADGKPTYTFTGSYAGFNPNGADHDTGSPTTVYGTAGATYNFGSVVGSYSPLLSSGGFFSIGLGTTLTPTTTQNLYAFVNDTSGGYGDNAGSYKISVLGTPGPIAGAGLVPLLGLAGAYLFRRKRFTA